MAAVPAWAERGQINERSLERDGGKKQKPPPSKTSKPNLSKSWWKTVGDPAIYAFRDCAVAHVSTDPDVTSPGYKAGAAIFGACSKEYDFLYGKLFEGYGDRDKVSTALDKITKNIVLPAVSEVFNRRLAGAARQQGDRDEASKQALNRLFDCGADSSRRLASATTENAETVATAVLSRCSPHLNDYIELEATTYQQRQDLEQYLVSKFRPFVIQQIVETRAGLLPSPDSAKTDEPTKGSSGSGFFVTKAGEILTNHHVVDGCKSITVFNGKGERFGAVIRHFDSPNDLALLWAFTKPDAIASFRSAETVRAGEDVVVFGYPYSGLLTSSGNVVTGTVTALEGLRNDDRFFQVSAPVQPGNSGGALLDRGGNVIGIVQSKLDAINVAAVTGDIPQNINFAIKGSVATRFLANNGVKVLDQALSGSREVPAVADLAKSFSVRIECGSP